MEDDLKRVAVQFNNEYIGEADSFEWKKTEDGTMSLLSITGEYQAGEE